MKQQRSKRFLALLLSALLLIGQSGTTVHAKEPETVSSGVGTVSGNTISQPEGTEVITITVFDRLDDAVKDQTVEPGTKQDDLILPATLGAWGYTVTDGTAPAPKPIIISGVTWEPDSPWDETALQGAYTFTPVLPAGYALTDNAEPPKINVGIEAGLTFLASVQYNTSDIAAFQAILDAHPSLQGDGVDREDPASWQSAGLVSWDNTSKRLTHLYLSGKNLTGTLDVAGFPSLQSLYCYGNPGLTGLTLGQHGDLTWLSCFNTGISGTLDVAGCPSLQYLYCNGNPGLMSLTLGQHGDLTRLDCSKTGISGTLDVAGYPSLQYLSCDGNPGLTGLTLGQHGDLTWLDCSNTGTSGTLDVAGCPSLQTLRCYGNPGLTGLTLGQHGNLTWLDCNNTGISGTLDVAGCPSLQYLSCFDNPGLTGLTLGQHGDLTWFYCSKTGISGTLDVAGFPSLQTLRCYGNPGLTGLTLGQHGNLTWLDCNNTGISGTLDVAGCPSLQYLSCFDNPGLTGLTLGQHGDLTWFYCSKTGISGTLDVAGFPSLQELSCFDNPGLTGLTLGQHGDLTWLDCSNTGISGTLDVAGFPSLQYLSCFDNPGLTGLTLGQHGDLTWLDCSNTGISGTLDVAGCPSLQALSCYDNPGLMSLTLGKHEDLTSLYCGTTGISGTLDVSGYPNLQNLSYDGKSLVLKDGTIRAENGGRVKVQFGSILVGTSYEDVPFTLTALPDSGYQFNGWTGLPVGVSHRDAAVSFTPGTGYAYTASFTPSMTAIPVTGVTLDKQAHTLYTNKDPRSFQLTATVAPADASNKAVVWKSSDDGIATVDGSGNVTAAAKGTATITVTTADGGKTAVCTVTVETHTGGNGSGDGGSSGGSGGNSRNYITTAPQPPKPNTPVLAVIGLPVTVGKGTAAGHADDGRTASAIDEAGRDVRARTNGIAVQYDVKTVTAYDGFSITIKRETLERLTAAGVKYVTLNTGIVDLTFDLTALMEIQKQTTGDITLTATQETGLTGDMLTAVGARPAYRLAVNYTGKDGRAATVQDFGGGSVTVGLACKTDAAKQTGSLFLVYSRDGSSVQWFTHSSYDKNSGSVIGKTGHFSLFGVGRKTAPAFSDTASHWAKEDIDFAASRDLLTGTGSTAFTPEGAVTRGIFAAALGRLAGIDPAAYPSRRFTDVAVSADYAPYVEWAASRGIITGTGEQTFSPDDAITREQMAAIMQRYADKLGYTLPVVREAEIFTDGGQITGSMKNAVQAMQQAGIMNGRNGRRFEPGSTATRAEAAAVLRRFVKTAAAPAIGGWSQNDAGLWQYYENSRPVTGWKQIEGTWYYFDAAGLMQAGGWQETDGKWHYLLPDGAMAVNTKIDGYEIGPDGARKEK